jgi:hypothetical protein
VAAKQTQRTVYLEKANADLICHCTCARALIRAPLQMDCPWCGCGWLFSCIECRKAFTFAKGVEVAETLDELARHDLAKMGAKVTDESVYSWVGMMKGLLAGVEVGKTYVYFDGVLVPSDIQPTPQDPLELGGLFGKHRLAYVPQVHAKQDRSVVLQVLTNERYWRDRVRGAPKP